MIDDDVIELNVGGAFTSRFLSTKEREQVWDEMVNTHGFVGEDSRVMVDLVIDAVELIQNLANSNGNQQVKVPEHVTDGGPCWCEPEIDYTDPKTGVSVIVHKRPQ